MDFNIDTYLDSKIHSENFNNKERLYEKWYSDININNIIPIVKNGNQQIFDYYFYISRYKDLSHMTYHQALTHWNNYGIKEGRKSKPDFNIFEYYFDYEFYTTIYSDLQNIGYYEALEHFTYNGIKEKRLMSNTIHNSIFKIIISVQLNDTNLHLIETILTSIKTIKYVFKKVNVIITIPIFSQIEKYLLQHKYYDSSFIILKIENHKNTNDIFPFLKCLQRLEQTHLSYDYLIKFHNFTECYSNLTRETHSKLIASLGNYYNVILFQHYLMRSQNIGYISQQQFLQTPSPSDLFNTKTNIYLEQIYKLFSGFPKKQTSYISGNHYWLNYKVIKKFIINNNLIHFFCENFYKEYINIFEIIITGNFCINKTNILINNIPINTQHINLGHFTEHFFKQPQTLSLYRPNETF